MFSKENSIAPSPFSGLLMTRYHLGYLSAKYQIQYLTITCRFYSAVTGYRLRSIYTVSVVSGCEERALQANTGVVLIVLSAGVLLSITSS